MSDTMGDLFGEVISSYSRSQAIEDGALVDVSRMAREAGIKAPICMTRAAWSLCVSVPRGVECQDEKGRLWDVLWMLRCNIRGTPGCEIRYTVLVRNDNRRPRPVSLKAIMGPGDNAEPVITIMLPDED